MATEQLALHAFWYWILAGHIYGFVEGVGEGLAGGGTVVRGRDPCGVLTGAGGRIRAGAVRCTGVSFAGS